MREPYKASDYHIYGTANTMNTETLIRENERMIIVLRTLAGHLGQFAKPGGPKPTKDELWSLYSAAMYALGEHVGRPGTDMTEAKNEEAA